MAVQTRPVALRSSAQRARCSFAFTQRPSERVGTAMVRLYESTAYSDSVGIRSAPEVRQAQSSGVRVSVGGSIKNVQTLEF